MKCSLRLVSSLVLLGCVWALVGCGGRGVPVVPPSSGGSGGSGISVTIIWPQRGGQRLIPGPCDSVRVMLIDPGTGQVATQPAGYDFQWLIVRPSSTAQFTGLPMGVNYQVAAVAYDQSDGNGVCLAGGNSGTVTTPSTPDTNTGANITMASVIDQVVVSPSSADLTIPPGGSLPYQQQYSAEAWDNNDNPIYDPYNSYPNYAPLAVPAQGFDWSENSSGTVCSVDTSGLVTAATVSTSASATITATEQDTAVQGTANCNVYVSGYDVTIQ